MVAAVSTRSEIKSVKLEDITIDPGIQSRVKTDMMFVHDFAEAMANGAVFPPVTTFYDGRDYWLADGFHRIAAYKQAGISSIPCTVRNGSRRDAIIFSAGANQRFSIKRKSEDIKRSIDILIDDPAWSTKTMLEISKHVGVSVSTVGFHMTDLKKEGKKIHNSTNGKAKNCIRGRCNRKSYKDLCESKKSSSDEKKKCPNCGHEF